MRFFKKRVRVKRPNKQWKITKKCLELIIECSKSNYPNEFGGLLRMDKKQKDTIHEIMILPGTVSGDSHAIFRMHMLPIDFTVVGTVHSHPSPYENPSDADLHLFGKHGKVHIIVAYPYNDTSWKAYDYAGNEVEMKVL